MQASAETKRAAGRRPSYVLPYRVSFQDTNLMGNVYFAHLTAWQGRCREMFLADHAPEVLDDLRGDLRLVTVSTRVDFAMELFAGDDVEVHLRLVEVRGHVISMDFEYLVQREGGWRVAALGAQEVACMRGQERVPPPAALAAALRKFGAGI